MPTKSNQAASPAGSGSSFLKGVRTVRTRHSGVLVSPKETWYAKAIRSCVRTIPVHAHPLVKRFFRIMKVEQATYDQVARRAGIGPNTILKWRKHSSPSLLNFEAVLNVLGKKLIIVDENYNAPSVDTKRPCPSPDNGSGGGSGPE